MRKIYLLLILPFVLIFFSTAQDRTDTYEICEWEKLSGVLKAAKGWAFNEREGKWMEN